MRRTTQPLRRSAHKLLEYSCVGFMALVATVCVIGQAEPQYTANKSDDVLRSTGRVNPSSLGMEIQIPLGSYGGRGMSVPISLSYSSKVWRMLNMGLSPKAGVNQEGCDSYNMPLYADRTASGWNSSVELPYVEYSGR